MKNTLIIFTCVYAVMTIASVAFMGRTLYAAKQHMEFIEAASAERLVPLVSELAELESILFMENLNVLPQDENFMLGLHEGYITVFFGEDGTKGIKEVTATPLSALPQEEWVRLALGITIRNEEELSLWLQDYGS
jgi:hypothetical protein